LQAGAENRGPKHQREAEGRNQMKAASMTIDRMQRTVTIVLELETARPSKATGKTMLIASTRGLRTSKETYARRPVYFTANVLYFPASAKNTDRTHRDVNREREDTRGRQRKLRAKRNKLDEEPELSGSLPNRVNRRSLFEISKKE
jgi:hypothetical protein